HDSVCGRKLAGYGQFGLGLSSHRYRKCGAGNQQWGDSFHVVSCFGSVVLQVGLQIVAMCAVARSIKVSMSWSCRNPARSAAGVCSGGRLPNWAWMSGLGAYVTHWLAWPSVRLSKASTMSAT